MAEFRLNCPGCGAEYVLPQDAIPPAGREVECSRCDHVWQAQRPVETSQPLDLGSFTMDQTDEIVFDEDDLPPPLPPASKRLSPEVLDILRDEVEHERRLREADDHAPVATPDMPDNDWPATTVTVPTEPSYSAPRKAHSPAPASSSTVIRHLPARSTTPAPYPQPAPTAPPTPTPRAAREQTVPDPIQTNAPAVPPHAARSGYRTGFGLSVLVAACCVGLYIATPKLAAQDLPFGAGLMQLRTEVDQARLWLSDRVTGPDGQTGRLNAP